jgi:transcriptional regulator with XRE-family HTH domain
MNEDRTSLGHYLRELRALQRMSLYELSGATGIAYTHLSRIENDATVPSPETIVKLATALHGDLTLMLEKANNLPRIILDRLIERDRVVSAQTLRRAIPARASQAPEHDEEDRQPIEDDRLTEQETAELREAMESLLALRPHARRAIIGLISILRNDEDEDGNG